MSALSHRGRSISGHCFQGRCRIVLCHNHPSGCAVPSESDMEATKKVKEAGKLMGIALADHIIIGGDSYLSFKEAEIL